MQRVDFEWLNRQQVEPLILHIAHVLDDIVIGLEHIMTAQDDINAAVAAEAAAATAIASSVAYVAQEIEALKAANPAVDTTGLDAATATLTNAVATLQQAPTPPADTSTTPPADTGSSAAGGAAAANTGNPAPQGS